MTASWTKPSSTPTGFVGPFSTMYVALRKCNECQSFVWESQTSSRYPRTRSSAKNGRGCDPSSSSASLNAFDCATSSSSERRSSA